jgi:hypothetical protein
MSSGNIEMTTFTIGFTEKPAERFFLLLREAGVKSLLDVRLNNTSQLSGFAKRDDLKFFLREICEISYREVKDLAPSKLIWLTTKKTLDWNRYEDLYLNELSKRSVERLVERDWFDQDACFAVNTNHIFAIGGLPWNI